MNELICEMCGSNNIVKQDGLYVCQSCSTKYSVEEARKLMQGEKVEVEGTVKIDQTSDLENLYEVARRAKDTNNNENALRYYDQILVKNPNDWEAQFYVVYFKAMQCKIAEISLAANNIINVLPSVLELVKKDNNPPEEELKIIYELSVKTLSISTLLFNAAKNHYDDIDFRVQNKFAQDYLNNASATADILYNFGNYLIKYFGETYRSIATTSWEEAIKIHVQYIPLLQNKETNNALINRYVAKIQIHNPTYKKPKPKSDSCYIATSIYGSYDCPEVWTLRRYRDNTLKTSIFGRLFIKTYYGTSPTLVKYFGDKKLFKKLFKPILDSFVKKLNDNGVNSSFYIDK